MEVLRNLMMRFAVSGSWRSVTINTSFVVGNIHGWSLAIAVTCSDKKIKITFSSVE
jgi:hypothetical protein